MAGLGVAALRRQQLLLADQHVDDRARADLVAGLGRVERTLRRDDRLAGRFDLAGAGDHGAITVARAAFDQALLQFVLVLRRVAIVDRLANPRLRVAAGEDRHVEGQSDRGRPALAVGVKGVVEARRAVVGPGRILRVQDLAADRRQVAGACRVDVGIGRLELIGVGTEARILRDRDVDPVIGVFRIRLVQRQLVAQLLELARLLAGQLAQGFAIVVERVLRGDHVGHGGIVLGLGIVDVGDRRQADLEALLGLLHLAVQGLLVGLGELERILGREHVEIRGGDADQQVLLGGLVGRVAGLGHRSRRFQRGPLAQVEDALVEASAQGPAVVVRRRGHVDQALAAILVGDELRATAAAVALRIAQRGADLRQQGRTRLVDVFAGRVVGGFGAGQLRIRGACLTVDLDQVVGMGQRSAGAEHECQGQGQGTESHHRIILGCAVPDAARLQAEVTRRCGVGQIGNIGLEQALSLPVGRIDARVQ